MALMKVRSLPGPTGCIPLEILLRRLPPLIKGLQGDLCQLENTTLHEQLIQLGKPFSQIHKNIVIGERDL